MRLLRLENTGEVSLLEYFGKDIPRYAILSHTWGADYDEVTYKDIVKNRGRNKTGYDKIRFCGKQAANDGLQHFWIDTCCIDKSSSAELSEAINSMFRWYYDAAKCYVYLSDVSVGNSQEMWKPAFRRSRWFTRGWTLQELIAPVSIEFFSVEGVRLGNMNTLMGEIHDITRIHNRALQRTPLSQFSVKERMSWAKGRETKREEDAAYSLLGIFDIHMPLIYGEGQKKALIRLQKEINEADSTFPEVTSAGVGVGYAHIASKGDSSSRGKRALVLYDYQKAEDNEIELQEDEYVVEIEMVDEDWWMGQNSHGERGLFPSNYVEIIEENVDAGAHGVSPPSPAGGSGPTATAMWDYDAAEDNELSFLEGATITNIEFPDEKWWYGSIKGQSGLFPANYVLLDQ